MPFIPLRPSSRVPFLACASVVSLIPWFHLSRLPSPARDFVRRVVIVRESASALPLPHLLKHPERQWQGQLIRYFSCVCRKDKRKGTQGEQDNRHAGYNWRVDHSSSGAGMSKGLDTVHRVVVGSLGLATLVLGTSALLNAGSALSWHWSKDKRASESNAPPQTDAASSE
ncbi:unnamed protein product [Closterium sp. Naga37s-1]|nr:unnamed protein product [Closterium sp. Naga37s-1]